MESIFFSSLEVKNIGGLRGDFSINLSDSSGKPCFWNVLLGNNNTGKTTFLRCLASMQVERRNNSNKNGEQEHSYSIFSDLIQHRNYSIYEKKKSFIKAGISLCNLRDGALESQLPSMFSDEIGRNFFGFEADKKDSTTYGYKVNNVNVPTETIFNLHKVYGYGTSRRISNLALNSRDDDQYGVTSLFSDKIDLLNIEEWLLQLDYAKKNGVENASAILDKIIGLITSEILPGLNKVKFSSSVDFKPQVEVLSGNNWVRINDLGYGYQATMAWLADLAKRMFDRYPELDNPLHGPAIVLVDEIDLHLHPEWQRKIIKYLSDLFPNTQFIVTAHSPLIVQSAENVNLIMLEKDETGSINVRQQFGSFQGWTVEEILRELMDMGEKTRSDRFLKLLEAFEKGLDGDNYEVAKAAYDDLDKILHPASSQRKLLSIQLSSLVPA